MRSFFITGTDTDVGKTIITAGLARVLKNSGNNVGVMKPFAAGTPQKHGYKSADVEFLAESASIIDSEKLVNPYFFEIPASPFTATQSLGIEFDIKVVIDCFKELSSIHDVMLVEGIGGVMTPILKNYFVTNLIKDMNLETIIVASSRIGTVNHTIMTSKMCQTSGIKVRGIIINNLDSNGYSKEVLKRDVEALTNIPVIGDVPFMDDLALEKISENISNNIDLDLLN